MLSSLAARVRAAAGALKERSQSALASIWLVVVSGLSDPQSATLATHAAAEPGLPGSVPAHSPHVRVDRPRAHSVARTEWRESSRLGDESPEPNAIRNSELSSD